MGERITEGHWKELRLFLEEVCCNLCRFQHMEEQHLQAGQVVIHQETYLGAPEAFADICVQAPGQPPYFLEVKFGYAPARLLAHLRRKYGPSVPGAQGPSKLVLVIDAATHANWPALEAEIRAELQGRLELEVWDEAQLLGQIQRRFGAELGSISEANTLRLRTAMDQAKGRYAFGADWVDDPLQGSLLWHFGFWRLHQLREARQLKPEAIVPPGIYPAGVVLTADLCSYSSYVRDTRDSEVVRQCLTSFYSKARYEILNTGGMLYQFVGDQVLGLYGIPDRAPGYAQAALECAKALLGVGKSVSHHWQRHIDRVQTTGGVHIGMAIGDIQVVALQPFGRARFGVVSDAVNMASRLLAQAGPSEIVVSNGLMRGLEESSQTQFEPIEPVEARNLGRIQAWKLRE